MYSNLFSPQSVAELSAAMQTQFPKAIWETFYVTLLSTALAVVIGLPLGVLLGSRRRLPGDQYTRHSLSCRSQPWLQLIM